MIADRVLVRLAEQDRTAAEAVAAVAPAPARVAGRAVLLVPHRSETPDEAALPGDYRKILAIVRAADGPVQAKGVGEELGPEMTARGRLEPLIRSLLREYYPAALEAWRHKAGGLTRSDAPLRHCGRAQDIRGSGPDHPGLGQTQVRRAPVREEQPAQPRRLPLGLRHPHPLDG